MPPKLKSKRKNKANNAVFMPKKEKTLIFSVPELLFSDGATGWNRTRVDSLGSYRSTIELRPQEWGSRRSPERV